MSNDDKELKLLFIQEELSQFGEDLSDRLVDELERKGMVSSGTLLDSIRYEAFQDGDDPGQRINFVTYGRYIDIQAYKKDRRLDTNKMIWGIKQNRKRNYNRKNWYAKNMYSGLNRLTGRVMYGLSQEEIKRLKGILQNRKNN